MQHYSYDGRYAEKHYYALYEVVYSRCFVSSEYYIHGSKQGHYHGTIFVWYAEAHFEKP